LLILYAWEVDDDGATLSDDFWFGDTEGVNALADDFHCDIERIYFVLSDRLQGDRHPTLQVKSECRRVTSQQVGSETAKGDHENGDERYEKTSAHGASFT
jgi:hypothetical protein